MYFTIALNKIDTQHPQKGAPLMFDLTLRNTVNRVVRVLNFDFELWLDGGGAPYTIIGQLRPDYQNAMDTAYKFIAEYQADQQATLRFCGITRLSNCKKSKKQEREAMLICGCTGTV